MTRLYFENAARQADEAEFRLLPPGQSHFSLSGVIRRDKSLPQHMKALRASQTEPRRGFLWTEEELQLAPKRAGSGFRFSNAIALAYREYVKKALTISGGGF
jgi:hypothetical protein